MCCLDYHSIHHNQLSPSQMCVSEVPEVHCEPREDSALPMFLNLNVSLPNGLILHFNCEDSAGEMLFCVHTIHAP